MRLGGINLTLIDSYSKEELEIIVENSSSIKEVVSRLGYSTTSGRNHETVKKRIKEYGIDISHFKHNNCIKRYPENIFVENSTANQTVMRR